MDESNVISGPVVAVAMWMGRPVTELSKEELLKVIEHCGKEMLDLQRDRARWRNAADPAKYLMQK